MLKHLRSHPHTLEDTPDPSPTVSVWEFLSLFGFRKSRVSSQGMCKKYGRIIETSYLDVRLEFSKWLVNGL